MTRHDEDYRVSLRYIRIDTNDFEVRHGIVEDSFCLLFVLVSSGGGVGGGGGGIVVA